MQTHDEFNSWINDYKQSLGPYLETAEEGTRPEEELIKKIILIRKNLIKYSLVNKLPSIDKADYDLIFGRGDILDMLYKRATETNGHINDKIFDDGDIKELTEKLFHIWTSAEEITKEIIHAGAFVFTKPVQEIMHSLAKEAMFCFGFQQYIATCAICRSILEKSLYLYGRNGKTDRGKELLNRHKNIICTRAIDTIADATLRQNVNSLYKNLCAIVHTENGAGGETLELYKKTLEYSNCILSLEPLQSPP